MRRRNISFFRHHRRRRRNPDAFGGMSSKDLLFQGGGAAANFLIARSGPAMLLPQYNTGLPGYGLNAAFGAAGAWAISKFDRRAGQGAWIGLVLALVSRFVAENFGSGSAGQTAGMSGDMDFTLGYYVSDGFPFAQGAGGPYNTFPGNAYLPGGTPITSAAAVRAGAAAASAALPAAAPAVARIDQAAGTGGTRWGNRW
jgi:hypothetical protein